MTEEHKMFEGIVDGDKVRILIPVPGAKPIEIKVDKQYRTAEIDGADSATHLVPFSVDANEVLRFGNNSSDLFHAGFVDISTQVFKQGNEIVIDINVIGKQGKKVRICGHEVDGIIISQDRYHGESYEGQAIITVDARAYCKGDPQVLPPPFMCIKEIAIEHK